MFGKNYSEFCHFHSLHCTGLFWVIWPVMLILHYSNFSPCNQPPPITCLGWMTKCALDDTVCTFALWTFVLCTFAHLYICVHLYKSVQEARVKSVQTSTLQFACDYPKCTEITEYGGHTQCAACAWNWYEFLTHVAVRRHPVCWSK